MFIQIIPLKMVKRHTLFALVSLLIIALNCCVSEPVSQSKVILVNLKAKEVYQYDFGYWDSSALAVITIPAKHAETSSVEVIPNYEKAIYTYSPANGFVGKETVEITIYKGEEELNCKAHMAKIHLDISVSE